MGHNIHLNTPMVKLPLYSMLHCRGDYKCLIVGLKLSTEIKTYQLRKLLIESLYTFAEFCIVYLAK